MGPRWWAVLLVIALGVSSVACSEDAPIQSVPDAGKVYQEIQPMVDELAAGGVDCDDFKILPQDHATIKEFGLCFISKEHETDIYLMVDQNDVPSWVHGFGESELSLLVGNNWIISSGSLAELRSIRSVLGGELREGGDSP